MANLSTYRVNATMVLDGLVIVAISNRSFDIFYSRIRNENPYTRTCCKYRLKKPDLPNLYVDISIRDFAQTFKFISIYFHLFREIIC